MKPFKPSSLVLRSGALLTIREATRDDAAGMLAYVDAISGESDFLTFGPGEFGVSLADEADFLERSQVSANRLCIVATISGEIVGSLTFQGGTRPRTRHTGEMGLSVKQAFWSMEIGTTLLDAFIGWAREGSTIRKINLRVRIDNARAIRIYERKGFVLEGTVSRDIFLGGRFFDCHYMGLILD